MKGWTSSRSAVGLLLTAALAGLRGLAGSAAPRTRPAAPAPRAPKVYSHTFETPPGREWSRRDTDVTPKGGRRFLGRFFRDDDVVLKLQKLPKHKLIRLSFDLYVIQGVDGNSAGWGPDLWEVHVVNGQRLLHTTFCNRDAANRNNEQSFPDEYGIGRYAAWTGCLENQTLGWTEDRPEGPLGRDSVYRMQLVFPHTAGTLGLRFGSDFTEVKLDDREAWGLDNVKVEALAEPERIDPKTSDQLLGQLAGSDAAAAYKALWRLAGAGDATVAAIRKRFGGGDKPGKFDPKIVDRLIAELDHDDWRVRKKAGEKLVKLGSAVEARLRQELAKTTSEEVRTRIPQILAKITGGKPPTTPASTMRTARLTHLLEVIGTQQAEQMLTTLRDRTPDFRLRHMAHDARARLLAGRLGRARAAAQQLHEGGRTDAAVQLLRKALGAADDDAVAAKSRLSACLARLESLHKATEEVAKLRRRLKTDLAHRASRLKLIHLLLVKLDRPAEAAKHLSQLPDTQTRANLALAAGDPKKLSDAQCLTLGRWYHQLALETGSAKEAMLRRSVGYYERVLDSEPDEPAARKAALDGYAKAATELLETELAAGSPVDLLRLIRTQRDTLRGKWDREDGFHLASQRGPPSAMRVPMSLAGSYEFTVRYIPWTNRSIEFDFPVGAGHAAVGLHAEAGGQRDDAIHGIDGRERLAVPGAGQTPSRTRRQREQTLHVKVLLRGERATIAADLDRLPLLRWTGPQKRLKRKEVYENHKNRQLAFGTQGARVVIRSFQLRMLSGSARLLR